jgi:ribosome-associated protein
MKARPFFNMQLGEKSYSIEEAISLALGIALDKKAARPLALDLRSLGAFTEYFLILSGQSGRQVSAIAEGIRMFFKSTFGLNPTSVDGFESQTWILLDYGYFFVHVFQEPTRNMYQLEQLWSKAKVLEIDEQEATKLFSDAKAEFTALNGMQPEL